MKIGIASDHRGYNLKEQLKAELMKRNFEVVDYGTNNDKSTDKPSICQFEAKNGRIINKFIPYIQIFYQKSSAKF